MISVPIKETLIRVMATSPASSITLPTLPLAPPPATQPNKTADTSPPSSPATPATSSPPLSQSPPSPIPSSPPPSPPLTPPPTATPPPSPPLTPPPTASTPPSPPADPPAATLSPPPILTPPPPLESSPPPPSESSPPPPSNSPPPPSKSSPPQKPSKPTPPSKTSPPPQHPPFEASSPPPPLEFASPPSENSTATPLPSPPKESPVHTPSPPGPLPPTTSPPPPIAISSPPPSVSFFKPPTSSSKSGSLSPPTSPPLTEKPTNKSTTPGTAVAIGVVVGFLALSLVLLAVWYTRRRKKRNGAGYVMPSPFPSSHNSDSSFMQPQNSPKIAENGSARNFMYSSDPNSKSWFTYEDLYDATQGFSSQKLLGEGGFGCVYKGLLEDGREVAVKQLKIGGGQGEREFRAEVEIISRVHHRYLVSLVGYCISDHQRLLVYEYLPNDTLHFHLHGEGRSVMEWSTRVKVAAGAARGIAYLHEDCHPRIIHRDIKSSNILLDNNFDARVADFGLAKLAADANTHVTTRVMGTFGYMAPEYASSGKLTEKSDVFSYGVVLLELVTGRKPVDGSQPIGDESLVEWAKDLDPAYFVSTCIQTSRVTSPQSYSDKAKEFFQDWLSAMKARPLLNEALETEKFEALIDPRIRDDYIELEMFRLIEAAAACIRHSATKRPRMSQVVRAFDSLNEYQDLTNGMKLGQSQIHNSREQSAQIRMFQRMAFGTQQNSSDLDLTRSSWKSSNLGSST